MPHFPIFPPLVLSFHDLDFLSVAVFADRGIAMCFCWVKHAGVWLRYCSASGLAAVLILLSLASQQQTFRPSHPRSTQTSLQPLGFCSRLIKSNKMCCFYWYLHKTLQCKDKIIHFFKNSSSFMPDKSKVPLRRRFKSSLRKCQKSDGCLLDLYSWLFFFSSYNLVQGCACDPLSAVVNDEFKAFSLFCDLK